MIKTIYHLLFRSSDKTRHAGCRNQECYDLTGTHYYNPDWGMQDGANSAMQGSGMFHEPMAILNHYLESQYQR